MTHTPLRIGLIGTGRIGQVHAASIAADPQAELAWIADPEAERARTVSGRFGGRVTDSAEQLIDSGDIDAVLIASPTPTHVSLIGASVEAGRPVFCEKPIDLDITRVDALRKTVASAGVPVALGFNRRFDPGFASAQARTAAGEIGRLEQLTIISRDPTAPPADYVKVSGGIFRDMTIHDFDMARFFLPDIVQVSAVGSQVFDPGAAEYEDFDTAVVTLLSRCGATVSITNSRHSTVGYDQRLEAFGDKGTLQVVNAPSSLVRHSTAEAVEATARYQASLLERYADSYTAELSEFIRLARGEESASPTFDDGRAALILANAAQRSAETGAAVAVDLETATPAGASPPQQPAAPSVASPVTPAAPTVPAQRGRKTWR